MDHYIFKQLKFVRENTLKEVREMEEASTLIIPKGFNNHMKWHLGHIYVIQEKFAFQIAGLESNVPKGFLELFNTGTKPLQWAEQGVPTNYELIQLLQKQINRIEEKLEGCLHHAIEPYTTSTGLSLSTVKELMSFCLYHEGMHFNAIKSIKRMI